MKSLPAILFSTVFSMTCFSQSLYHSYGPETALEPNSQFIVPLGFQYNKDVMVNFTYNVKTYKNNKLTSEENATMLETTPEELAEYGLINVQNMPSSLIVSSSQKVTDTILYQPNEDEIIFQHNSNRRLFDTPSQLHTVDELIYVDNNQIIAKQDQSHFIKFFYDSKNNLSEIISYSSILEFDPMNTDGENGIPTISLTPSIYVKLAYDHKNRIVSKWIYQDQSELFENTNTDYNESLTLLHYTGSYNNNDQIRQKEITSYRFKNFEPDRKALKEFNQIFENPSSVHFEDLTSFFHSKEVIPFTYKYNDLGKLISQSEKTELWQNKNGNLEKTAASKNSYLSITYKGNTTTLDEKTIHKNAAQEVTISFNKKQYVVDSNLFLIEYTQYEKNNSDQTYQLIKKETMDIIYK